MAPSACLCWLSEVQITVSGIIVSMSSMTGPAWQELQRQVEEQGDSISDIAAARWELQTLPITADCAETNSCLAKCQNERNMMSKVGALGVYLILFS